MKRCAWRIIVPATLTLSAPVSGQQIRRHALLPRNAEATPQSSQCFGEHGVAEDLPFAIDVIPADLDSDGRVDFVAASLSDDRIVWFRNDGGNPPQFTPQVVTTVPNGPTSVFVADLDGDSHPDVICTSKDDGAVRWFRHDGAAAPTFQCQPEISSEGESPDANKVIACDLDGDGRLDVAVASAGATPVAWYRNDGADPPGFGEARVVSDVVATARSVAAADLDADGDLDLVSVATGAAGRVQWYENLEGLGGADFVLRSELPSGAFDAWGLEFGVSVVACDIDADADPDIVACGRGGIVAWWENRLTEAEQEPGDVDGFGPRQLVAGGVKGAWAVTTGDVDADGLCDIIAAASYENAIVWFHNVAEGDGARRFIRRAVTIDAPYASAVEACDVDGDGDLDLLATLADANAVRWYENDVWALNERTGVLYRSIGDAIDGASIGDPLLGDPGQFGCGCAAVLDDLGKGLDIASSGAIVRRGDVETLIGPDGSLTATQGPVHIEGLTRLGNGASIASLTGDIDVFGELQVPNGSIASLDGASVRLHGEIEFGENAVLLTPDLTVLSKPVFPPAPVAGSVPSSKSGGSYNASIDAVDIDGDGDTDIFARFYPSSEICWFENLGASDFQRHLIYPEQLTFRAQGLRASDVDGDGDPDLLVVARDQGTVSWFENRVGDADAGPGGFGDRQDIDGDFNKPWGVEAADLDGDGDEDVIVAVAGDNAVLWYQNDGLACFQVHVVADGSTPPEEGGPAFGCRAVATGDMDGDGDLDVLSASIADNTIRWYENRIEDGDAGPDGFLPIVPVLSQDARGANAVLGVDLDGDGDTDAVSSSFNDDEVVWYENIGGVPPVFVEHRIASDAYGVTDIVAADVDGDGDLDLVSASWSADKIDWYENRPAGVGPPTFVPRRVARDTPGAEALAVADLDGDGDLDVLAAVGLTDAVLGFSNRLASSAVLASQGASISATGEASVDDLAALRLEPGTALEAFSVSVHDGSAIVGAGTVISPTMASAGILRPDPGTALTIDGNYTQWYDDGLARRNGELRIELGDGTNPAMLAVSGSAELAGALLVSAAEDATWPLGARYTILTALSLAGSRFDVAYLPRIGSDRFLAVVYDEALRGGPDTVSLEVVSLGATMMFDAEGAGGSTGGTPRGATLADIDADGDLDLLLALPDPAAPTTAQGSLVILYNRGVSSGTWLGFGGPVQLTSGVGVNPSGVAVGHLNDDDMDGVTGGADDQLDILVSNRGTPGDGIPDTLSVLLVANAGEGTFSTLSEFTLPAGDGPADVIMAHLDDEDSDGVYGSAGDRIDIVAANSESDSITVAFSVGSGSDVMQFDLQEVELPEDSCPLSIRPGDFDASLHLPFVAVANAGNGTVGVIIPDADPLQTIVQTYVVGSGPVGLVIEDIDADGLDDIVTVNRAGNSVSVLLNESSGPTLAFGSASDIPVGALDVLPSAIAAGDFDADLAGDTDLAILADGRVKVWRNDLSNGLVAFTPLEDATLVEPPILLLAGDVTGDSATDIVAVAPGLGEGARAISAGGVGVLSVIPPRRCRADLNGDARVDILDVALFLAGFGEARERPIGTALDLDLNAHVDIMDFGSMLWAFGRSCEADGVGPQQ